MCSTMSKEVLLRLSSRPVQLVFRFLRERFGPENKGFCRANAPEGPETLGLGEGFSTKALIFQQLH